MKDKRPYWERKRLEEMSHAEWEALCDGCGKCCLHKLEDADTGDYWYTDVACRLLDGQSCRCRHYGDRHEYVPTCLTLTPRRVRQYKWLPESCAYRRITEGRGLSWWHPLVSGDPETVHLAGVSVRGRTIAETMLNDEEELQERVLDDGGAWDPHHGGG